MTAYEDVLYDDYAFSEAHPAHVRAIGHLFGMPLGRGPLRVLDVGCGLGGHLLPLAEQDPEGTYVGIDLSAPQIARGQQTVDALGLDNVDLRAADLMAPPDDLGTFDIIVCHGVYSWVPAEAQAAIWRLFQAHLAPQGIAYISFNTYPGWRHRGTLRDVLLRLVPPAGALPDRERITQAREVLSMWGRALKGRSTHRHAALSQEIDLLSRTTDAYLLYEHLAELNRPSWFGEVLDGASQAGLTYLGDAVLSSMFPDLDAETRDWIAERAPTLETMEQVHDLIIHRLFRRSLFVREHVALDRELHWRRLEPLSLLGRLTQDADDPRHWTSPNGSEVTVQDDVAQRALEALLAIDPAGMPFEELARTTLGADASTRERAGLGRSLMQLVRGGLLDVRTDWPDIRHTLPERPLATPLARHQAGQEGAKGAVNLRHEPVKLGVTDLTVLRHLDGEHTRDDLLAALTRAAEEGPVEIRIEDELRTDAEAVGSALDMVLDRLRRAAFLVG